MTSLPQLTSLVVVLTAGCNLRCSYCYQATKSNRCIPWPTLRDGIDTLLASHQPRVQLQFYGGEPLLAIDQIRRAVDHVVAQRCAQPQVEFGLTTNGTLLRGETLAFVVDHDFDVNLSFDGVPAAQNERGAGTFVALDRLLTLLHREHPEFFGRRLTIGMTLRAANIPHFSESIEYFLMRSVQQISVGLLTTHDADWNTGAYAELERQFARIVELSRRHRARTGQVPFGPLRAGPKRESSVAGELPMCGAVQGEKLTLDIDGVLYGCAAAAGSFSREDSFWLAKRMQPLRVGSLDDPQTKTRLANYSRDLESVGLFHRKQSKYSSARHCYVCPYVDDCFVCPLSIGAIPGNTDADRIPDMACAFNRLAGRAREQFGADLSIAEIFRRGFQIEDLRRYGGYSAPAV